MSTSAAAAAAAAAADETTNLIISEGRAGRTESKSSSSSSYVKKIFCGLVVVLLVVLIGIFSSKLLHTQDSRSPTAIGQPLLSPLEDPIQDLLKEIDSRLQTGRVVYETDSSFEKVSEIWNQCTNPPRVVIDCHSEEDVMVAIPTLVTIQQQYGIPFRIKSGGHSYTGWSGIENGIILSVANLKDIDLDTETGIVTVGPGATVQDVSCVDVCLLGLLLCLLLFLVIVMECYSSLIKIRVFIW